MDKALYDRIATRLEDMPLYSMELVMDRLLEELSIDVLGAHSPRFRMWLAGSIEGLDGTTGPLSIDVEILEEIGYGPEDRLKLAKFLREVRVVQICSKGMDEYYKQEVLFTLHEVLRNCVWNRLGKDKYLEQLLKRSGFF